LLPNGEKHLNLNTVLDEVTERNEQILIQKNELEEKNTSKYSSKPLKNLKQSIDRKFSDKHWDYFIKILDFFYPAKDSIFLLRLQKVKKRGLK